MERKTITRERKHARINVVRQNNAYIHQRPFFTIEIKPKYKKVTVELNHITHPSTPCTHTLNNTKKSTLTTMYFSHEHSKPETRRRFVQPQHTVHARPCMHYINWSIYAYCRLDHEVVLESNSYCQLIIHVIGYT